MKKDILVVKKDGTTEIFNSDKILSAITKSSNRIGEFITEKEFEDVVNIVVSDVEKLDKVFVQNIHNSVEKALDLIKPQVAKSYKDYRNYKKEFGYALMTDIEDQVKRTLQDVDRENSNSNTRYISTKRTDIAQTFSKELYQKMFLSKEVVQAIKDGFIYIHDLKEMILPQYNCCLADISNILKGGFELEGIHYNEPKDIRTAIGQFGDVVMIISAQQYGGFTAPEVDKILAPYYERTIIKYEKKYMNLGIENYELVAREDAYDDLKQSMQGLEIMLNTVVNARGTFPFSTFTFGNIANKYESDICRAILEVRMEGHGKIGFKKNMIFPKLVFLHNDDIHGSGKEYENIFDLAVKCSSKCMYPDYIGHGHRREGKYVSPMGCRAYLSNYRDEHTKELIFTGRFNIGAVSLNLPMILMKSKEENKDFYEILEYYLQMIREIHINRYDYLGKAQASSNPLMFCEGGAYGGNLKPEDRIAPLLKSATASFGITALNELQVLYNGKRLSEDQNFANEVMDYINNRVEYYKKQDGWLYAIYNTPAESLCGTQIKQFRKKYGIIDGVSDREYFTNSNHLWVGEEINPFEKQDKEIELFKKSMGGHIGYVRISNPSNLLGLKNTILRGLELGFYQGVNFNACTCNYCGHQGNDFGDTCPKCGSYDVNEVNRVTGYLGHSRKRGDRTLNDAMMDNVKDRVSM